MMRKTLTATVLATLALPLCAAASNYIEPGQWQQTIHISAPGGKTVPPKTSSSCVKPEDAAHMRQALTSNQPKGCKVSHYDRDGDVVTWQVDCDGATKSTTKGKMTRQSDTAYTMVMDTSLSYGGQTRSTHITGEAHRTGACQ